MNNDKTRFTKPWAMCVGSDRVSTMLRAEYWERFDTMREVMPVRYIRCHGLLCDELAVVRRLDRDGKQVIVYNFTYLDQIFDTMAAHRVRPYVEWGFMPEALASGEQTVFWWKGNVTPPKEWGEWADLVTALTRHWIARYGAEEVRQWPFEVWNEPNLDGFWKGADQKAYFTLYETTVKAIKAVDAEIKVGGPAICGGQDHWIDDFLTFVKEKKLPLDNFTRHLYSGETPKLRTSEIMYQALANPEKPIQELEGVRAQIDKNGFASTPLHITEFNTSWHPRCPVHDTPYNAAHLARLLAESGRHAEQLSFWTFSDVFEEDDVPRALFHGGFGMIARHGILKPTFHLFAFFNALGEKILHQDERCIVTERADGTIATVAWNPRKTADTTDDTVTIRVTVPWNGGNALALRKRVNEHYGNPWDLWKKMGRPLNPTVKMIDFLKTSAVPAVESAMLANNDGTLAIELTLDRNEITFAEFSRFQDDSSEYIGLDDALVDGYSNDLGTVAKLR